MGSPCKKTTGWKPEYCPEYPLGTQPTAARQARRGRTCASIEKKALWGASVGEGGGTHEKRRRRQCTASGASMGVAGFCLCLIVGVRARRDNNLNNNNSEKRKGHRLCRGWVGSKGAIALRTWRAGRWPRGGRRRALPAHTRTRCTHVPYHVARGSPSLTCVSRTRRSQH